MRSVLFTRASGALGDMSGAESLGADMTGQFFSDQGIELDCLLLQGQSGISLKAHGSALLWHLSRHAKPACW